MIQGEEARGKIRGIRALVRDSIRQIEFGSLTSSEPAVGDLIAQVMALPYPCIAPLQGVFVVEKGSELLIVPRGVISTWRRAENVNAIERRSAR